MFSDVSPVVPINYKNVFDHSIYDQTGVNFASYQSQNALKVDLIQRLKDRKLARLQIVLLTNSGTKIKQLEDIVGEGSWFWSKFFKPVFGGLPLISVDKIESAFVTMPKDEAKKELFKLTFQVTLLKDGIDKEPVYELEMVYVLKKRKIPSKEVQHQIEKALLAAREDAIYLELTRQFIDIALTMPDSRLKLQTNLGDLATKTFFKNFDPELLKRLRLIAHKFVTDSNQPDDPSNINRGIYYFHGDPGTGKSRCAVELLKLLGLPFFLAPIRRMEDLSGENLEGTERTLMSHNPGIFVKTLSSRVGNGHTYTNGVLILDDFDRVLLAESQKTGTPSALAFLLDYLDPGKKTFYNHYFGAHLDISRLSIIITANQPIPAMGQAATALEDPYAALRSRVTQVHFPNFPIDTLKTILTPVARDLMKKYDLKADDYKPATEAEFIKGVIDKAIAKQQKVTKILEPRDMARQLEIIISAYKLKLDLKEDDLPAAAEPTDIGIKQKTLERRLEDLTRELEACRKQTEEQTREIAAMKTGQPIVLSGVPTTAANETPKTPTATNSSGVARDVKK